LLGAEQSGQINQVGFSLYSDMLARAVEALRSGQEPDLEQPLRRGVEIELHLPALIPESYLADVQSRLTLYKRIASARTPGGLRALQVEMIDRFGLLPDAVKNLFEVAELKLIAERIGINMLDFGPQGGRIEFLENAQADPGALISLMQESRGNYLMQGPQKLRILVQEESPARRLAECRRVLSLLEPGN
jgi:transcription-repair coupling factor (superfamily II helicase)